MATLPLRSALLGSFTLVALLVNFPTALRLGLCTVDCSTNSSIDTLTRSTPIWPFRNARSTSLATNHSEGSPIIPTRLKRSVSQAELMHTSRLRPTAISAGVPKRISPPPPSWRIRARISSAAGREFWPGWAMRMMGEGICEATFSTSRSTPPVSTRIAATPSPEGNETSSSVRSPAAAISAMILCSKRAISCFPCSCDACAMISILFMALSVCACEGEIDESSDIDAGHRSLARTALGNAKGVG